MALVIPPGFANAAFVFSGPAGTQPYVTTLGLDISGSVGSFVDIANDVKFAYSTAFQPRTNIQLSLDRVTLAIGSDGPSGSVDSDTNPFQMARTGSFPPTALSGIARKVTNELGRQGRGRMFLPGVIAESDVDSDGTIIPASRTALNTALDTFLTQVNLNATAVLLHSPPSGGGTVPLPSEITGLVTSNLVGWIRGRIR